MKEINRRRRGHSFLPTVKGSIPPPIGSQEGRGMATMIYVHYFIGAADWYISEMDPTSRKAYGWVDLGNDSPEWGYIDLEELERVLVTPLKLPVERDLYFEPQPISKLRGR